jgi:Zn-dependent protease with chaperone function
MDSEQRAQRGYGIRLVSSFLLGALLAALCGGCRTVSMTGRKQLLLVPEASEIQMGVSAFDETLSTETPSQNQHYVQMVQQVGQRISAVADRPDYQWDFRVIASPQMNAFCLPGGKVAVYEGILPVCYNEAGLAVVMSHEIAHALARHGGERMSQGYVVNGVGTAVDKLLQKKEVTQRDKFMQAYGMASQYGVILPYSRKHESEADHMGLMLMAKAGYDPAEAPRFWERFGSMKSEETVEFMSTHPSDARRASDLAELLPEAMKFYEAAPTKLGSGALIQVSAVAGNSSGGGAPAGSASAAAAGLTQPPPLMAREMQVRPISFDAAGAAAAQAALQPTGATGMTPPDGTLRKSPPAQRIPAGVGEDDRTFVAPATGVPSANPLR